jgi:hypothetical protein
MNNENPNARYYARFVPDLGFYDIVSKQFYPTHNGVTKYIGEVAFKIAPLFPNERMTEVPLFNSK